MGRAQRATVVDLTPRQAYELWTDVNRWPTFVDGFGHVDRIDGTWPQQDAKVVWRSSPAGRGVVTERVKQAEPGDTFTTQVFEEKLIGNQTATFVAEEEGGTRVAVSFDYTLQSKNPLNRLTDLLFIRRAQNDALARTLRRFATEAAEEAAL